MRKKTDYSSYSKKELQAMVKEKMKAVNMSVEGIRKEEERDAIESSFLSSKLTAFREITGTKSVKKVATGNVSRFSKKKLIDIINLQDAYLSNPWSTAKGRKEIFEKQYRTLNEREKKVSRRQLKNFRLLMSKQSDTLNEMRENGYLDSEQVLDISKKYNSEEIVEASSEIMDVIGNDIHKIKTEDFPDFIKGWIDGMKKDDGLFSGKEYFDSFIKDAKARTKFSF